MPDTFHAPDPRAPLLAQLRAHPAADAREREMTERIVAFVAATPACFERTWPAGHVTGSAWVVDRDGTHAVLAHHRKLGRWLQLGGHADGETDVRAVARREAREESGLTVADAGEGIYDVDVHEIPARDGRPAHVHYDVRFAFFADRAAAPVVSDESHAVAWIALRDLDRYGADASIRRLASKTARLVRGR